MQKHYRRSLGWLVHAFTASGACIGVLSLFALYQGKYVLTFWLMAAAIFVDGVDGMFARMVRTKEFVPEIDGALLDNIVDFVNYTIVPCFFLMVSNMLPDMWRFVCVAAIVLASAYQFTQCDAKTDDHFFKGFPSYWNIAVFYLFFWQTSPLWNLLILTGLAISSFIPIKYVYPSRLTYLTHSRFLRLAMISITVIWGLANLAILFLYPETNDWMIAISISYLLVYLAISLYRTFVPLAERDLVLAENEE